MAELLRRLINNIIYPLKSVLVSPRLFFAIPRKILGLSLPARWALFVFFVLLMTAIASYMAVLNSNKRVVVDEWTSATRIVTIAILNIVIPLVVYKGLKLWLEGEVSRYPDIDNAWRAGIDELRKQGMDLTDIPLFLVLGCAGENEASYLFDTSRLGLNVRDLPKGPAPLHWFANQDGVYLVLDRTCRVSRLAQLAGEATERSAARGPAPRAMASGAGGGIRGTIQVGQDAPEPPVEDLAPMRSPGGGAIRGTLSFGSTLHPGAYDAGPALAAEAPERPASVAISTAESLEIGKRLTYVCELIRRARQPLCPINGILAVLPFELIERGGFEATQVQKTAKEDLETVRRELRLRCPVTALVVGMESEPGFRELVQRVGLNAARAQRFGKGHPVWVLPTAEELEALSAHACAAFEMWTYNLFREKGALSKPGNAKLFQLLCKIRRSVRKRLTNILADAFSAGDPTRLKSDPLLFSGCYFGAAGSAENRQAFVKNVFDKLPAEQEELEWSSEALRLNRRYNRWARFAMVLDTGLVALLIGGALFWYFRVHSGS
jgi:hypothetical protein